MLSVMFCDLVGSTELSSRMDPEDLHDLIRVYQACVTETIGRFGGFIARYVGDGVLVYFGWPQASETDAERAVGAALETASAVAAQPVGGEPLQVRIGIASGLVVVGHEVGEGQSREQTAIGETPNRAARLQALAGPGQIVIDAATRRLLGSLFDCRTLGDVQLKGLPEPIEVFEAVAATPVQNRFKALRQTARSSMVDRVDEFALLLRHWERARAGRGSTILMSGEPGIGKSRLLAALDDRLRSEGELIRLRCFCSPYQQATPLHPIIGQLEFSAGFDRDDTPEEKLRKLQVLLAEPPTQADDLALIAELLGLPVADSPHHNLSPLRRRERTYAALLRRVEMLADKQPLLLMLEDAHWADPSTIELLTQALPRLHARRALIVVTFRPEFQPPWTEQQGATLVPLSRLDPADARQLAMQVIAGPALVSALLSQIVAHADGVPLFIEELTKGMLETRRGDLSGPTAFAVPETLQASLMARLDRNPVARQVAQIGAVLGREFPHTLLAAVADMAEAQLLNGLAQLVTAGLLFCYGTAPDARYVFKHALIQEVAYESLLRRRRSVIHARTVEALERLSPETSAAQPELLAYHCSEAGLLRQAADYYRRAGEQALRRSAIPEARSHLERGLQVIAALPDTVERQTVEAGLLLALGSVGIIQRGFGNAETAQAISQAVTQARRSGESRLLVRALFGEWNYRSHIGDLAGSQTIAQEMLQLGRQQDEPLLRLVAGMTLGMNYTWAGRFLQARTLFEECLQELDRRPVLGAGSPYPQDQQVLTRACLSLQLACLGYCDQAAAESRAAIERARQLQHQPSLAVALTVGCRLAWLLRDTVLMRERATELVALCEEYGFPYWLARGRAFTGLIMVTEGKPAPGLALMRDASATLEQSGILLWNMDGLLGEAYACAGDPDSAQRHLQMALDVSARTGEAWLDAELLRQQGEIVANLPGTTPDAAETLLRRALVQAREQSARLWELRAAMSLARLLRRHGRTAEVRAVLEPVCDWFSAHGAAPGLGEADLLLTEVA
ncbi:MAG TPA: adenylate/guanylate cyclase domain-containing protein [Acetobacteraceae bacterium]|nr:adenylate/guanylate cyclase domain-containing protein [Acetobacteraceae bacterium]